MIIYIMQLHKGSYSAREIQCMSRSSELLDILSPSNPLNTSTDTSCSCRQGDGFPCHICWLL